MFEFKEMNMLTDGEIDLRIHKKTPAEPDKGFVPAYHYHITLHGSENPIGSIDIRIGDNENLYYGGHIGYSIKEEFRGMAYAAKACRIIKEVAIVHKMNKLIITCNPDNFASRRTCEKAGLNLVGVVDLPDYNDMYQDGERQKCIYEWDLN
ncbi:MULTISPECIES: GNAT family N-acetyltransferase [unclassified Fusibacter]|uniref:GNAT family N-acetyltransferase n=1 Tax=unclassified Fusibacter TaxID=2624464 RepID=UPI001010D1BD|nr:MULTISPECIES: GNAT family N-acetyltransferase [unclassified Fusibacter]MCK8058661.1 GNAT family N-acetyltransferase [Fusibacter sp. A2]NPE21736.1 GNAT family N-acetyltransferase [Fusibacter sp. A1]RXV61310.1 GNAT family N-acetyltransferase [Fusibacter sp. A1]